MRKFDKFVIAALVFLAAVTVAHGISVERRFTNMAADNDAKLKAMKLQCDMDLFKVQEDLMLRSIEQSKVSRSIMDIMQVPR